MPTKKRKKLDPRFVSSQLWELKLVAQKFAVSVEVVRQAKKDLGKGRRRLYLYLRQLPMGK